MNHDQLAYLTYSGVKVSNICYNNLLETIIRAINDGQRGYICLTDVSNLMVATQNNELRAAINNSLFSLADGTPLVWFAWLAGCTEIERISGASLLQRLLADMSGFRHYLLGDTAETIAKVIAKAKTLNGDLEITGYSPPFKEFEENDDRELIARIKAANCDIVWVCFGGVKQEIWMNRHLNDIDRGIMIGVGAAFRFFTGDIMTPPPIFQKLGLQWVFRIGESFFKNPVKCVKVVYQRQILTSKFRYLVRFPFQVAEARQQIKSLAAKPQR